MSYTIELNEARKDANYVSGQIKANSPVVEVFSAMVAGKNLSQFGNKADVAAKYIMELNEKASMGDVTAQAELNELRRYAIEPILMKEMNLLSIFGSYENIGFNDNAEIEVVDYVNVTADIQAFGQSVKTPTMRTKRIPISTTTISGGYAVDYRKAMNGDMSKENELQEQVRVQIRNKASKLIMDTVYDAITNSSNVKYSFQGAGLTKTGVDGVVSKVRRIGRPTIIGDYALVSQLNGFAGYQGVTPNIAGISDDMINQMNNTGLLGVYNGSIVSEMPNEYDYSTLNKTGDNFATVLPVDVGFVIPTGGKSPIHTITRGGLTTFTGNDVSTGTIMTRMDMSVGVVVEPGREYEIGLIKDTNLA